MPSIHLQLLPDQDRRVRALARKLDLNRSAFIRQAIDEFSARVERDLLADQFRKASQQCRTESIEVCREFEAFEENSDHV